MGRFCQDIPLKCFTFFTLAFIVLITQYALFIKNAGYTAVGSKLPFKPSINEQVLKLPKKGRIWKRSLLCPREIEEVSKFILHDGHTPCECSG